MELKIKSHTNVQVLSILAGFYLLYHHAIATLISDWSTDPNFSHGFLIPFICAYMIWYKKNEIALIEPVASNWGLVVLFFGMFIHLAGHVGAEQFLMRFSMVITLAGIVIYCWGGGVFKQVFIPIAYLVIMIPIPSILWNKIAFPLQLMAAKFSSEIIYFIGIPVFREGNILHLANTSLEVVDACSGLRSLTSLLALTGVFAFLAPLSGFKKWILFLSAIPIAVLVNVIRLTITAAMAAWISPDTAHGFLHDMSGLIIFGFALVLVYLVYLVEMKIEHKKPNRTEN
jgi:exosortase